MVAVIFSNFTRRIKIVITEKYLGVAENVYSFSLDEYSVQDIVNEIGSNFNEIFLCGVPSKALRDLEDYYFKQNIKITYL